MILDDLLPLVYLSGAFLKKKRHRGYDPAETLAHESVHAARTAFPENSSYDEYFPCQVHASRFRRLAGNLFRRWYIPLLFFLGLNPFLFVLPLMILAREVLLLRRIRIAGGRLRALGLRPVSVYFGGGTPTTLSPEELERVCSLLETEFDLGALREYTVEAGRPDTITEEKLRGLRRHGVDRVSVNPQTMSDKVLEIIGRKHTAADILTALEKVRRVGGFAVNMDLIAGLPGDDAAGFSRTLDAVLSLGAENITVHTLSLKKGSRITLEGSPLPSEAEVGAMLDEAASRLRQAGYEPYYLYRQKFMSGGFENVGWTRPGFVNLYNICIMEELCSILAMGGGGSTKLIAPGDGRNIRLMAPKYPLEYIQKIDETCADKEKIREFYDKEWE